MLMQMLVMLLLTVCMYPAAKVVVIIIRRATKHFIQWEESFITYLLLSIWKVLTPCTKNKLILLQLTYIHTYLCRFRNMLMYVSSYQIKIWICYKYQNTCFIETFNLIPILAIIINNNSVLTITSCVIYT